MNDDEIALSHRLIVFLSQQANAHELLSSVLTEVLREEQRLHKRLLYPLKVDELIKETALTRGGRMINFTGWSQKAVYQQALNLLSDQLQEFI